jgi:hypothetical protein
LDKKKSPKYITVYDEMEESNHNFNQTFKNHIFRCFLEKKECSIFTERNFLYIESKNFIFYFHIQRDYDPQGYEYYNYCIFRELIEGENEEEYEIQKKRIKSYSGIRSCDYLNSCPIILL